MDKRHRDKAAQLRVMGTETAAAWIMENWRSNESWNIPKLFLQARLTKSDTLRIADHVMRDAQTHTHDTFYKALIQRMGMRGFLDFLDKIEIVDERDRSLMHYHLKPIFEPSQEPNVQSAWKKFEKRLLSGGIEAAAKGTDQTRTFGQED